MVLQCFSALRNLAKQTIRVDAIDGVDLLIASRKLIAVVAFQRVTGRGTERIVHKRLGKADHRVPNTQVMRHILRLRIHRIKIALNL